MSLPWYRPTKSQLDWLNREGVTRAALEILPQVGSACVAFDGGKFWESEDGQHALTFVIHDCGEFIDFAAWRPRTGHLGTWRGAGFAIGQDQIFNPASYFSDSPLRVHRTPLDWLKAERDGIVIMKPELTYAYLRNVRRISFADASYARHVEQWLQPPKPRVELLVEIQEELAA